MLTEPNSQLHPTMVLRNMQGDRFCRNFFEKIGIKRFDTFFSLLKVLFGDFSSLKELESLDSLLGGNIRFFDLIYYAKYLSSEEMRAQGFEKMK